MPVLGIIRKFRISILLCLAVVMALHGLPATAQTCSPDGDVNQDDNLTPADALLAFQAFLGIADPPLDACQQDRANVNQDGNLTPADALCIFQRFLDLPSCLDANPAFNGTFSGNTATTRDGQSIVDTITLILTVGSPLHGTFSTGMGAAGSISGSGMGNTATFTATIEGNCPGSFSGSMTLTDDNTLSFDGEGSDCEGSFTNTGALNRSESPDTPAAFREGWESASSGILIPIGGDNDDDVTLLSADAGVWFLGDTVAEFPECGPTPHRAEIFAQGGGQALRLTSGDSGSDCADNVEVALVEAGPFNTGFSVPISSDTVISFQETGNLIDPQSASPLCVLPPCGDTIALVLEDFGGNVALAYVLQRAPDAVPNESRSNFREVFLDPNTGIYTRNLFEDFSTIPDFNPNGAQIDLIRFGVNEHGSATIDNIVIK